MFPVTRRPARRAAALVFCLAAFAAGALAPAAYAGGHKVKIKPSGGDDTDAIRDAIELAGPDGVVELGDGTFRISESIIVRHSLTIKGAGRDKTAVIADASLAPDGIYPNISEAERAALQFEAGEEGGGAVSFVFVFHVQEERVGRYGLRDLTLGMSGLTANYDPAGESERLFSLVWVLGFDVAWLNSAGESPADIGEIDAEHRVLSTVQFRCENVFFDGKNRDPAAPDVRNAFGMVGGFVFNHFDENGEEVIDHLYKPVNGNSSFRGCRFADFPGQAAIYQPNVIGRDDPYWTFGPEAVKGAIVVRECEFVRTLWPVTIFDASDTRVVVKDCSFQESDVGVYFSNDYQVDAFEWIGYPETAMCKLLVEDSTFRDGGFADVWIEEWLRGNTFDARIRDCRFRLEGDGEVGIRFDGSQGAVVRDCDFSGQGEAGIYALDAEDLRLVKNDFCDLEPSNPEGEAVVVEGTTTIVDKDNDCLDSCTESEQDDD